MPGTLAIFGGSFNPPHVGHQLACLYILETQPVDQLVCVPTYRHPFDKQLAPYDDRLEMCRRMIAPLGPRASVSTLEEELGGESSRTYTLLEAMKTRCPDMALRLVIGADILRERDKWWRWADIEKLAPPIVLGRAGFAPVEGSVDLPAVSSTDVRARAAAGQSLAGLVPRSVIQYIETKGLYRQP